MLSVSTLGAQDAKPAVPHSVPGEIKQLAWMAGTWTGTMSSGTVSMAVEEQWVVTDDGSLTGTARATYDGKELSRLDTLIVQKGPTLHHSSLDDRSKREEHTLTQIGLHSVTFESQTAMLRYTVQKDGTMELHASSAGGARPMTILFKKK